MSTKVINDLHRLFYRKILDDTPSVECPVTIHMSGISSTLMRHLLVFLYSGQAYIEVSIVLLLLLSKYKYLLIYLIILNLLGPYQ